MAGRGPTEELAPKDSYLARAEGRVLEVTEGGLFLDRTVFYARGGGQPGDVGTIVWHGGSVEVVDTVRKDGKPLGEPCPDCAPCHADPLGIVANRKVKVVE